MSYLDALLARVRPIDVEPRIVAADGITAEPSENALDVDVEVEAAIMPVPPPVRRGDQVTPAGRDAAAPAEPIRTPRPQPRTDDAVGERRQVDRYAERAQPQRGDDVRPAVGEHQPPPSDGRRLARDEVRVVTEHRVVEHEEIVPAPTLPPAPEHVAEVRDNPRQDVSTVQPRPAAEHPRAPAPTPVAPGAAPERREPPPSPTVNIRIGRIVVQPPAPTRTERGTAGTAAPTHRTLEEYLARRAP